MADLEILKLKTKNDELNNQIKELNELVLQYDEQQNAAEKKINALNQIHQDKVRNLMNSITVLKKENAQLKNMNKEHKRSQLIEQLNQEIADQDLVIQTLKSLINDDARCDKAIIEALNKGPPKIKSLTREELKIECKRQENQIKLLKEQQAKKQQEIQDDGSSILSDSSILVTKQFGEFEAKIKTLNDENSDLKSNLQAVMKTNTELQNQIDLQSLTIGEMKTSNGNYIILNKKYEQQQKLLEDYKRKANQQEFKDITKELDIEEQKMLNKVQETKMESIEKQLTNELNIAKLSTEKVERELEGVKEEKSQLRKKYQELEKKWQKCLEEYNQAMRKLKETEEKLENNQKIFTNQISELNQKQQLLEEDLVQKQLEIHDITNRKQEYEKQVDQLQARLQRAGVTKQVDDINYDIKINKQIQNKLKQQSTSEDPKVLKKALQAQQEYYESLIRVLQQRINQNQQDDFSNVSSNISKLIEDQQNQEIDMISSDISQFKQDIISVDSNIEAQNIPSDIHSSISSILNAPKGSRKQIDQSIKSSDIDKMSSNISEQQNISLSKISSNLSKISFTSSMQRAIKKS